MPLSPPVERDPIHTRTVTCRGWRRKDGLWDVEGHLVDVRSYAFDNEWRGTIRPGEPLHEMWVRITVDETLTIRAIEAATDNSPFPACSGAVPGMDSLVGLAIKPGFTAQVKSRIGGAKGCTHLMELMGPVATTAYQTLIPVLMRQARASPDRSEARRAMKINSCHAYRSDGELVRRHWPEHYTGSEDTSRDGSEPVRK